ncbi:MAG TPA: hypothetical protein VES89_03165 [Candidatus Competibacteraceae bacterium]|nr:hypothetical protein [Candidatus Competibacteraceae bacterium]
MHRTIISLITALSLSLFSVFAFAAEEQPVGTIEFMANSAALGIGFSWGNGTLTYQGKVYPIKAEGLSLGSVGFSSVMGKGRVYNLKNLSDFDGTYAGAGANMTILAGGGDVVLKNAKGVELRLSTDTQGAQISIAGGGVKFKVNQQPLF